MSEFDNLATKIFKGMNDTDYSEGKVKKTMARYSKIKNNKIVFDVSFNSELDYHELKEKIKTEPENNSIKSKKNMSELEKKAEEMMKKFKLNSNDSDHAQSKPKKVIKKDESKLKSELNSKVNSKVKKTNYEDILMGINFDKNDECDTKLNKNKQIDKKSDTESDTDQQDDECYVYSLNSTFVPKKKYAPFGTDWIHDSKISDDDIGKYEKRRTAIFEKLAKMKFPPQKSQAWLDLRKSIVSASDGGCTLGDNDYEPQHKLLYKKVMEPPFEPNENCYHGNKYEEIATMAYAYRMNVDVREFGLVKHPNCDFLGASPDGIITPFKTDGKHLTKYVGRMLEIKCPTTREIKMVGEIKGNICPIYYWDQVQLQLECCDLDDCDFWQCKILEYDSRQEFIEDTDPKEPFRSKNTGYEKGCVIQVLPLSKRMEAQSLKYQMKKHIKDDENMTDDEKNQPQHLEEVDNGKTKEDKLEQYNNIVYESSKHIYPPKIEMTPNEVDEWISEVTSNFYEQKLLDNNLNIRDYYVDKVIFWYIDTTHCVTIIRDKEWFNEAKPEIEQMWKYVQFLRSDKEKGGELCKVLFDYADSVTEKMKDFKNPKKIKDKKMTKETKKLVMDVVKIICNQPDMKDKNAKKKYLEKIENIKERTQKNITTKLNKGTKFI